MDFSHSEKCEDYLARLKSFIAAHIEPIEPEYHRAALAATDPWVPQPIMAELQAKARAEGLWNLFLPDAEHGAGLTNAEYAPLAEVMGRSFIAPHVFNCNAPDTGNMEILAQYGDEAQKQRWLAPLLEAQIRSAFCMTEPDVASSDATNMQATAVIEGDEVVVNGRKWWSTGVGHPDCELLIFMGLTDPTAHRYAQHSMVLVLEIHLVCRWSGCFPRWGDTTSRMATARLSSTTSVSQSATFFAGPGVRLRLRKDVSVQGGASLYA